MIHRRGLLTGLISLVAAPAIVRASSLMPVRSFGIVSIDPLIIHPDLGPEMMALLQARMDAAQAIMARALADNLYKDYSPSPLDSWT